MENIFEEVVLHSVMKDIMMGQSSNVFYSFFRFILLYMQYKFILFLYCSHQVQIIMAYLGYDWSGNSCGSSSLYGHICCFLKGLVIHIWIWKVIALSEVDRVAKTFYSSKGNITSTYFY